jgi:serine/threonine protein kinase
LQCQIGAPPAGDAVDAARLFALRDAALVNARTIGTYELEHLLGEGGIGQVYAAQDRVLGRRVAIKMLRPELSRDRNFVERFYVEAKSLGHLNHTNITTLYQLHAEGDEAYMVMELVHGVTLDALLKQVQRLRLRDALAVLAQVVPGLRYAHRRGIIHRDIKPTNLMITEDGVLKIMDFGIARVRGSQHLTQVGEFCGTYLYASPEQIKGEEVDERSDLYSMAIVFYRMLAGEAPFTSDNEYALMTAQLQQAPPPLLGRVPELDVATETALMRALAKRPEDRFGSVEEFGRAVGAMALRGESMEILQQLYDRIVPGDAAEKTRVVVARRLTPDNEAPPPDRERLPPELPTSLGYPAAATNASAASRVPPSGIAAAAPTPYRTTGPRRWRWALISAVPLLLILAGSYYLFANTRFPTAFQEKPASFDQKPPHSNLERGAVGLTHAGSEPAKPSAPKAAAKEIASSVPAATATAPVTPPTAEEKAPLPPSPPPAAARKQASPPGVPVAVEKAAQPKPPATAEPAKAILPAAAPAASPASTAAAAAAPPSQNLRAATADLAPAPAAPVSREQPAPNPAATAAANPPTEAGSPATARAAAAPASDSGKQSPASVAAANPDRQPQPGTEKPAAPKAPVQVATTEPLPARSPPLPADAAPGSAKRDQPEGTPDLEGRVTGLKGLGEIELDRKKWIKLYGITDSARGSREQQHATALVGYLKPSQNHLVCYRKPADTYRCYSDGKDIARLALLDRLVRLAPGAPAEYRVLLARRR